MAVNGGIRQAACGRLGRILAFAGTERLKPERLNPDRRVLGDFQSEGRAKPERLPSVGRRARRVGVAPSLPHWYRCNAFRRIPMGNRMTTLVVALLAPTMTSCFEPYVLTATGVGAGGALLWDDIGGRLDDFQSDVGRAVTAAEGISAAAGDLSRTAELMRHDFNSQAGKLNATLERLPKDMQERLEASVVRLAESAKNDAFKTAACGAAVATEQSRLGPSHSVYTALKNASDSDEMVVLLDTGVVVVQVPQNVLAKWMLDRLYEEEPQPPFVLCPLGAGTKSKDGWSTGTIEVLGWNIQNYADYLRRKKGAEHSFWGRVSRVHLANDNTREITSAWLQPNQTGPAGDATGGWSTSMTFPLSGMSSEDFYPGECNVAGGGLVRFEVWAVAKPESGPGEGRVVPMDRQLVARSRVMLDDLGGCPDQCKDKSRLSSRKVSSFAAETPVAPVDGIVHVVFRSQATATADPGSYAKWLGYVRFRKWNAREKKYGPWLEDKDVKSATGCNDNTGNGVPVGYVRCAVPACAQFEFGIETMSDDNKELRPTIEKREFIPRGG